MRDAWTTEISYGGEGAKPEPAKPKPADKPKDAPKPVKTRQSSPPVGA